MQNMTHLAQEYKTISYFRRVILPSMKYHPIHRHFYITLLACFLLTSSSIQAQKKYWVFFSDKNGVVFDPSEYFDAAAIHRREIRNIPLVQYSDLPVREDYLSGVREITGNLGLTSRWFNAVAVFAGRDEIERISGLTYVSGVEEIQTRSVKADDEFRTNLDFKDDQLRESQVGEFGIKYFEEKGIDGTGVRIAIFDGGFPGVDTSPLFQHLRESGRIISTWDFVKNTDFVYDYSSHGTSVLTCIAGVIDGKKFGLAPGAEFLLARTEVVREVFSEEENWLAAVEWADKNGADIISSSLGYTHNRYFPGQMDGKSTLVTRSANMAATKGILVINCAGNDGDKKWEVISAPADADSVLSIGGIAPETGCHIKFSSFGPTADGRLKPNLVAFAHVSTSNSKKIKQAYGTSFSTPLVSGFAACVMQIHPEWSNMQVFSEMEKSGHLYPYFDYAHGYGVPQAYYFTNGKPSVEKTFIFSDEFDALNIELTMKEDNGLEIENDHSPEHLNHHTGDTVKETPGDEKAAIYDMDENYLYFKITPANASKIKRYKVVNMQFSDKFSISHDELKKGDRVSAYFRGFTKDFIYMDKSSSEISE